MAGPKIIVIGTSAGGVETLTQLVKRLPSDLPASVFIVMHFPAYGVSVLPKILSRCKTLSAVHPQDGEVIQPGTIYIAPPDYHLLVLRDQVRLSHGPRENGHRPAVDTLFRSASQAYRRQVVGVVLSGVLDDGTAGLAIIKIRGGIAIAQDPDEALFSSMPRSAIEHVAIDHILKIADIATYLTTIAHQPVVEEESMAQDELEQESKIVADDKVALEQGERSGTPSPLTCPECGGVLWELKQDNLIRFRCHTGHAYSAESLIAEQADDLERALSSAMRALEEKASLARRMAVQAKQQGRPMSETQFAERAQEAAQHAMLIRQMIFQQYERKTRKN